VTFFCQVRQAPAGCCLSHFIPNFPPTTKTTVTMSSLLLLPALLLAVVSSARASPPRFHPAAEGKQVLGSEFLSFELQTSGTQFAAIRAIRGQMAPSFEFRVSSSGLLILRAVAPNLSCFSCVVCCRFARYVVNNPPSLVRSLPSTQPRTDDHECLSPQRPPRATQFQRRSVPHGAGNPPRRRPRRRRVRSLRHAVRSGVGPAQFHFGEKSGLFQTADRGDACHRGRRLCARRRGGVAQDGGVRT